MSEGMENSLTEENPLFQEYLQQLQEMFPDEDESIIKIAISKFKFWENIVEALLEENEIYEEYYSDEISEEEIKLQNQKFGFPIKAESYEGPCRLYLPQSLISVDMDLQLFGSFNTDEIPPNIQQNTQLNNKHY